MTPEILAIIMFAVTLILLIFGFPVAFTLAGSALFFASLGDILGIFNFRMLFFFPQRVYGIMTNEALVAVPLFIFMGVMLEKTKIAENLLHAISDLFGSIRGGLAIAVILVGTLLSASTGIVGATVVTLGMLALPTMLKNGYDQKIATGTICASGTLGQIIPPSIVLILLAEMLQGANEEAGMLRGDLAPLPVTAIDLFSGALIPGIILVFMFILYIIFLSFLKPEELPPINNNKKSKEIFLNLFIEILPPIFLILSVLGSIFFGIATPTESASVGVMGTVILSFLKRKLSLKNIFNSALSTVKMSSFVFVILIGASLFSLVFRGFEGDELISKILTQIPGEKYGALLIVMLAIFILGFFLDYIEIIFVVIPIVGPALIANGADPLWLGILISLNLQTSFLTPPFGFSLFFLRGVTPKEVKTTNIYKGVIPFIIIQILCIFIIFIFPSLSTWLPRLIN